MQAWPRNKSGERLPATTKESNGLISQQSVGILFRRLIHIGKHLRVGTFLSMLSLRS
jgi:hypothetical protein